MRMSVRYLGWRFGNMHWRVATAVVLLAASSLVGAIGAVWRGDRVVVTELVGLFIAVGVWIGYPALAYRLAGRRGRNRSQLGKHHKEPPWGSCTGS
jgi:hypothetical protein